MRRRTIDQLPIAPPYVDHEHTKELEAMSQVLDELPPELWEAIEHDLTGGRSPNRGRKGMTAEQVLRILIVKQMTGINYDHLILVLLDFTCYPSFCRIELGQKVDAKTVQRNVKRISPESLEAINQAMMRQAQAKGIEDGEKLRADTTNVESNIHAPSDSTLLGDVNRVLVRLMKLAREKFGLSFSNHERRAKKRVYKILHAKNNEQRVPLYKDLLKVTGWTIDDAKQMRDELRELTGGGALANGLAADLDHFTELASASWGRRVAASSRERRCPTRTSSCRSSKRTPTSSSRACAKSNTATRCVCRRAHPG